MNGGTKAQDEARSKIGRLSFPDRMAFNRMLRDGFKCSVLIKWLADRGVAGVNAENIRKYKNSRTYRAWLEEEAKIDRDREAAEQAMRLAEALGGTASDKLKSILAGKLYPLLSQIATPDEIDQLVPALRAIVDAEKLDLQRRTADQRDEQIRLEREKFEEQKRRNAEAKQTLESVAKTGGLSEETLKRIEEAVKLL